MKIDIKKSTKSVNYNRAIQFLEKKVNKVIDNKVTGDESSSIDYDSDDEFEELDLNILITGREYLYNGMNDYVVESYFTSIAITIVLITILMMFILKSFVLGLISMLPNLVPLIFGAGSIYLSGKNIDVGIVLVSSICYGIAIDDTIHFLLDYKRKAGSGEKLRDIFKEVLDGTGTALTTTTFVIVISFSVFWFARFIPNYNFGVFSSLILTIALITDFLLLPSLLYALKFKREN